MDKVLLKNLGFYAYHGVAPEETKLGQKFFIDLELSVDLRPAGTSDEPAHTVCYLQVSQVVKKCVTGQTFQLIEALGEHIAHELLKKFARIQSVRITVKKPEAPIEGLFDYVGIELLRER